MEQDNSAYPPAYGQWGGNPRGFKPDYALCCERVYPNERGAVPRQCHRPRGHGPGLAYCRQHDPVAIAAKYAAKKAKWEAEWAANRKAWDRPKAFKAALEAIAAGHNDPRALAAKTLDEWK